jgi:uncharacterized protein (TIGR02302 family)
MSDAPAEPPPTPPPLSNADIARTRLLARLARQRQIARLVIRFEILWPAVWPALGVTGVLMCLVLLDLPQLLPVWLQAVVLALFALTIAGLLFRGLRGLQHPDDHAADRRLEVASGLVHRPLAVLSDQPAAVGGAAAALWQAHRARAEAQIGRLRIGRPRPGLPARDRRALRLGLVVALFAAVVIAGTDAPSRLGRGLVPSLPPAPGLPATMLQAWVTPPAYTAIPPIFLHPDHEAVSVPAGSHLTISVTGGYGVPSLAIGGQTEPFRPLDDTSSQPGGGQAGSFQADRDLNTGGRLAVRRNGRELAGWDLTVIADTPPTVAFTEPPGRAARGLQTRLPWTVADDYGVTTLQAELRLAERPDAPPLVLAIPLPGGATKQAHGAALHDLTALPWAGLSVTAHLVAHDAPGQTGTSSEETFDLPERRFQHPVARALIAIRKGLALHPEDRAAAIHQLDDIAAEPEALANDHPAFLNLRAIGSLLQRERSAAAIDAAQARLWQLALHLEEGTTERTARTLAQARRELRDAMERQAQGEKSDPKEMDRLMQNLQQAIQQHLQALTEQARRDHADPPYDRDGKPIDGKELDRMAQEMRDAEQQDKQQEAQERMAELDKKLDALQNARPERGGAQKAQRRQKGRQQMSALQDMVQREGHLLDHAQQRAAPSSPRSPTQPPDDPDKSADNGKPQGDNAAQQRKSEQLVQQALRRALGEMMQQFGDLTGEIPPSLGEADGAMRDSGQALSEGHDPAAAAAQQHAIEALQKGGREMAQQMAKMFGRQPGQQGQPGESEEEGEDQADGDGNSFGPDGTRPGEGRSSRPRANSQGRETGQDSRRDPLGRLMQDGTSGDDESDQVRVPDKMEQARTRAIQEELRRRGAERDRPQEELEYIDRLLRQF